MASRERVLKAISHQQPDMVPIDLDGTRDSTIVIDSYERLKKHFGIKSETVTRSRWMRTVKVDESILQKFDIDTRSIAPGALHKSRVKDTGQNSFVDDWGVERIQFENSYFYEQVSYPLSGNISISDILSYEWPDPEDAGLLEGVKERLDWIRLNTDCAAILTLPAPFIHISQFLRGYEDWYCDFASDTKLLETLFDVTLDITLQMSKRVLELVGKEVDIVATGDDLPTQRGLPIHLDQYKKYIKPRHKNLFSRYMICRRPRSYSIVAGP